MDSAAWSTTAPPARYGRDGSQTRQRLRVRPQIVLQDVLILNQETQIGLLPCQLEHGIQNAVIARIGKGRRTGERSIEMRRGEDINRAHVDAARERRQSGAHRHRYQQPG
jgi:hypothetical protein